MTPISRVPKPKFMAFPNKFGPEVLATKIPEGTYWN